MFPQLEYTSFFSPFVNCAFCTVMASTPFSHFPHPTILFTSIHLKVESSHSTGKRPYIEGKGHLCIWGPIAIHNSRVIDFCPSIKKEVCLGVYELLAHMRYTGFGELEVLTVL